MKLHPVDFQKALSYSTKNQTLFPSIDKAQLSELRGKAHHYLKLVHRFRWLHNIVTGILIVCFFIADYHVLIYLPELWAVNTESSAASFITGAAAGVLHGWMVCSITTFLVHEVNAHHLGFIGKSPLAGKLNHFAANLCRLFMADPVVYRESHLSHHKYFGTVKDASFTNHVSLKRLLISLLPASPVFSYSDFFPWRSQEKTPSRSLSMALGKAYMFFYLGLCWYFHGFIYSVTAIFIVGSWFSYAPDRIRETMEHFQMPLGNPDGTRNLGLGFWGLFLGGGPWGQPCHLSHHLFPELPWYFQVKIHFDLKKILRDDQRKYFILRPFIGVPGIFIRLIKAQK